MKNTNLIDTINAEIIKFELQIEELRQSELQLKKLYQIKKILLKDDEATKPELVDRDKQNKKKNFKSVGSISIEILREAGTPLHIRDITLRLLGKGKKVTEASVTVALSRLLGISLQKTYPNTFDLFKKEIKQEVIFNSEKKSRRNLLKR